MPELAILTLSVHYEPLNYNWPWKYEYVVEFQYCSPFNVFVLWLSGYVRYFSFLTILSTKFFITARKRSLRRLCFTRVCNSVHSGGGAIPACIAGGIPACLAAGLWGVSQHALQVSRPTQGGSWGGSGQGVVSRPTPREVSRPTPRGVSISACTEADPPTATAADGTHPTGMHSCFYDIFRENKRAISQGKSRIRH